MTVFAHAPSCRVLARVIVALGLLPLGPRPSRGPRATFAPSYGTHPHRAATKLEACEAAESAWTRTRSK